MSKPIRLQKLLSEAGYCSRRKAEEYIRSGVLEVNKKVATLGDHANWDDVIHLKGKKLNLSKPDLILFAWHKPKGVEVTFEAARDKKYKTLLDFNFGPERVFPIGRLDKESRGLLLLTNDGDLANKLMHPRYEKEKEYIVTLHKEITDKKAEELGRGILIDKKKTAPCTVEHLDPKKLRFILKEGRNRQIRKMCGAIGFEVIDLFRTRVGNIELGALLEGRHIKIEKKDL